MRVLLVLLAALLQGPAWAEPAPSFQALEESLTCQCGCGLTVHSCNHLQCPSALPLRQAIREQMALGKTQGEILAHFEQTYGEKILSAPTTRGFNLVAWSAPFVMLLLGGGVVVLTLRRWRGGGPPTAPPGTPAAPSSDLDRQLDRELRDFEA